MKLRNRSCTGSSKRKKGETSKKKFKRSLTPNKFSKNCAHDDFFRIGTLQLLCFVLFTIYDGILRLVL